MEGRFGVLVDNLFSMLSLDLEVYGLFVPFINGVRGGLHLVDSLYEKRGNDDLSVLLLEGHLLGG